MESSDLMSYFNTLLTFTDNFLTESKNESLILNCFYFDWNYNLLCTRLHGNSNSDTRPDLLQVLHHRRTARRRE